MAIGRRPLYSMLGIHGPDWPTPNPGQMAAVPQFGGDRPPVPEHLPCWHKPQAQANSLGQIEPRLGPSHIAKVPQIQGCVALQFAMLQERACQRRWP